MKKATLALIAFLALCVTSAPAAAAPIFSDDFEAEDLGLNEADLINWTISEGTIDVIGTGSFASLCAGSPTPGRCVDLDGSSANAGRIETTSSFLLAPGMYELSFWLSGSQRGDTNTVTVTFGTQTLDVTLGSSEPWAEVVLSYLSLGETTTIAFNHAGGDNLGILLDNVELSSVDTAAVPEPTSLVLFGTGALMALRRRRAAKSKS